VKVLDFRSVLLNYQLVLRLIKCNGLGISEVRDGNLIDTCFEYQVDKGLRSQAAIEIFLFELETDRHEVIEPEAMKSRFKKWHENIIGK
jgi:hypothetical protein